MAIILPSGFNITNVDPIDSRFAVATQAARLGFSAANVYEGLVVFQQDTNELYVLTDTGSYNSTAGWALIGYNFNTGSFATTGSNRFNGNQTITGSLIVTGGITGSIASASYATTASYWSGSITNATTSSYSLNAISASYAATASYADNFNVAGTITAQKLVVQTISSSVVYSSGSTKFGNDITNTHQFTGSVLVTGSITSNNGLILTDGTYGSKTWMSSYIYTIEKNGGNGPSIYQFKYNDGTNALYLNNTSLQSDTSYNVLASSRDLTSPNNGAFAFQSLGSTTKYPALSASYSDNNTSGINIMFKSGGIDYNGLSLTSAGNVGIGTSSPSYSLDVSGSGRFTNGLTNTGSLLQSGSSTFNGGTYLFKAASTGDSGIQFDNSINGLTSLKWASNAVGFGLMSGGGILAETNGGYGMSITTRDKGTPITNISPGAVLNVRGSGSSAGSTALLIQNNNASASLSVLDNGYVGIGTTTPSASLQVGASTGTIQIGANANANITATSTGGLTLNANIGTGNPLSINSQFNFYYNQLQGNGSAYFIDWLGAGSISRAGLSTLSVYKAVTATSGSGLVSIGNGPWDNTTAGFFTGSSSGTMLAINAAASYSGNILDFQTTGSSKLVLTAAGNLGIGTTTPSRQLHVMTSSLFNMKGGGSNSFVVQRAGTTLMDVGTDNASIYLYSNEGNHGIVKIQSTAGSSIAEFGNLTGTKIIGSGTTSATTALLIQNANASASLTVLDNGYVGIGTTSPNASLHIKGTTISSLSSSLLVQNSGATASLQVLDNGYTYLGSAGINARLNFNNVVGTLSAFIGAVGNGGLVEINSISGVGITFTDGYGNNNMFVGGRNNGSVAINKGSSAVTSAVLEVVGTNQGFLPPRTDLTSNITSPAQGLMTYLTGSANEGLYYYNSGSTPGWNKLLSNTGSISITGDITGSNALFTGTITAQKLIVQQVTSSVIYSSGSNIFGNSLANTHQFTGSIYQTGSVASFISNVGIGTTTPTKMLDLRGDMYIASGGGQTLTITTNNNSPSMTFTGYAVDSGFINIVNNNMPHYTLAIGGYTQGINYTGTLNASTPGNGMNFFSVYPTYNTSGTYVATVRGFYYSPTLTSTTGLTNIAIETTSGTVIFNGGKVGIGTSTPSASLHISGTTGDLFRVDTAAQASSLYVSSSGLVFINKDGSGDYQTLSKSLVFGSFAAGMRMANYYNIGVIHVPQGNLELVSPYGVGIGTTYINAAAANPAAMLSVRSTGATTASFGFSVQNSNTSSSFAVRDDGYVGIGTITPNASLHVAGTTILSSSFNTAISGSTLKVIGSGSTQPIFTVVGSQGELFSITDSLSGSLFSVNDISGLPILEVFSDNTILTGDYQAPALNTTKKITSTTAGINVIYSFPTSSYDGAFMDYTVRSGSNARAGNFAAIWSGSSVNYMDNSTTDFGSTLGMTLSGSISGSNMVIFASGSTAGWTFKGIIKSI